MVSLFIKTGLNKRIESFRPIIKLKTTVVKTSIIKAVNMSDNECEPTNEMSCGIKTYIKNKSKTHYVRVIV